MIRRSALLGLPFLGVWALGLAACGASDEGDNIGFKTGPLMLPGENCLRCHSANSRYPEAPPWTAGGTVFESESSSVGVSGAVVEITDTRGRKVTLTTNAAGNFYTPAALTGPFRIALQYEGRRVEMPIEAPAGSCNACHSHPDPTGGTMGRIRIPSAASPL